MIAASSFVAAVLFLEAVPVYLILSADYRDAPLTAGALGISVLCLGAVVALNHVAVVFPMRWGRKKLEAMEI
jgi:hypothetical protein